LQKNIETILVDRVNGSAYHMLPVVCLSVCLSVTWAYCFKRLNGLNYFWWGLPEDKFNTGSGSAVGNKHLPPLPMNC